MTEIGCFPRPLRRAVPGISWEIPYAAVCKTVPLYRMMEISGTAVMQSYLEIAGISKICFNGRKIKGTEVLFDCFLHSDSLLAASNTPCLIQFAHCVSLFFFNR